MARLGGFLGFSRSGLEFVKVLAAMFIAGYVARPSGIVHQRCQVIYYPLDLRSS